MKNFLIVFLLSLLAACGGGGSSPVTPPTPVSVTCPDGTAQTAATLDEATAQCPAPQMVTTPFATQKDNVPISQFKELIWETSSVLDQSTLTTATVKLFAGTATPVAGTVAPVGDKGFKFVIASDVYINYWKPYTYTVDGVKDKLGKLLPTISSTLTTGGCESKGELMNPVTGKCGVLLGVCPGGELVNGVCVPNTTTTTPTTPVVTTPTTGTTTEVTSNVTTQTVTQPTDTSSSSSTSTTTVSEPVLAVPTTSTTTTTSSTTPCPGALKRTPDGGCGL